MRDAVATQHGVDESMLGKVDDYRISDLSARQKAALALADVYLTSPASMTDQLRVELQRQFSAAEIVEIVLRVMQYSTDKIMVALGLDLDKIDIRPLARPPDSKS